MNPRLRRLIMDAKQIQDEFVGHGHVAVEPLGSEPPERYRVTYRIRGVMLDASGQQPVFREEHVVEVRLGATYPRDKPMFLMQTPIFHPNFGPRVGDEVCIGDAWTAAQPLCDLILKVGDMIQYREYNVKAPLNSDAARWVRHSEATGVFPVGSVPLCEPEVEVEFDGPFGSRHLSAMREPAISISTDDEEEPPWPTPTR